MDAITISLFDLFMNDANFNNKVCLFKNGNELIKISTLDEFVFFAEQWMLFEGYGYKHDQFYQLARERFFRYQLTSVFREINFAIVVARNERDYRNIVNEIICEAVKNKLIKNKNAADIEKHFLRIFRDTEVK